MLLGCSKNNIRLLGVLTPKNGWLGLVNMLWSFGGAVLQGQVHVKRPHEVYHKGSANFMHCSKSQEGTPTHSCNVKKDFKV